MKNLRPYLFVVLLASSYLAMMLFLAISQGDFDGSFLLFGAALVGAACYGVTRKVKVQASSIGSWVKYIFAAYAMAFGTWMIASIIMLPFYGYVGFDAIGSPWLTPSLLVLALAFISVTRRHIK